MDLPSSLELQSQILTLLNDQDVHGLPEVKDAIARKFEISNDDRKKLSKNKRPVFETSIIHSLSMLRRSGYIINQKRGNFKITKSGINRLKNL
jgi:restriction endonuclease Mrr